MPKPADGNSACQSEGRKNSTINPRVIPIPVIHLFFVDMVISFIDSILAAEYEEPVKKTKTSIKTLGYTSRMPRPNIGIFGGTFDPPHIGHLVLASEAVQQLNLSRLLWVLAPEPPHKLEQPITPLPHRLEMLKRTIANNPSFEISRIEIDRPGPHYSVDTVRLFAEQHPDADIIRLLGGDSLRDLPTWRLNTELVAAVSKIGVMRRFGNPPDYSALYEEIPELVGKIDFIDVLVQPISSREIRRRVEEGNVFRCYTLPSVSSYIEENQLYRGSSK